jgi:ribosomal protein L11 methyltransferase
MQWMELSLNVTPSKAVKATEILGRYGQGGAEIEEWESEDSCEYYSIIKIYLPFNRKYKDIQSQILKEIANLDNKIILKEKRLKQDEWFDSLRKGFKIFEIGSKIIIKPSWAESVTIPRGKVVIELDPGAAFGTGLHATTRLMLLNIEKYLKKRSNVFDLGTGTGILAIASAKLGASNVLAYDYDPVAVRAARYNLKVNQVDSQVQIRRGTLSLAAQYKFKDTFDLVLANITSRAISDMSAGLAKILKPGGFVIVSGIHPQGLDEVLIRLALTDLKLIDLQQEDQWSAVIAKKPKA